MSIFSYIVPRDYGFAPNPFYGCCTLATCKPNIRSSAQPNDWVIGLGSNDKRRNYSNKIIYAMRVDERLTFNEYWNDKRFQKKKPLLCGCKAQQYGDNIYHTSSETGKFIQENSHHSYEDGTTNPKNYKTDLSKDAVLVSTTFWYWGQQAVIIPDDLQKIRYYSGSDNIIKRLHTKHEDMNLEERLVQWLLSFQETGRIGVPDKFTKAFERYKGE